MCSGSGVLMNAEWMSQQAMSHVAMMAITNMERSDVDVGVTVKISDVTCWL